MAFKVSVITKGADGKATLQGTATKVESSGAEGSRDVSFDGQTFSVCVRKTQYGKATFDVTFPNQKVERVQVKVGTPKDLLPAGQKTGIRIELQESH